MQKLKVSIDWHMMKTELEKQLVKLIAEKQLVVETQESVQQVKPYDQLTRKLACN